MLKHTVYVDKKLYAFAIFNEGVRSQKVEWNDETQVARKITLVWTKLPLASTLVHTGCSENSCQRPDLDTTFIAANSIPSNLSNSYAYSNRYSDIALELLAMDGGNSIASRLREIEFEK
ncbi:hypothetical protein U1Q18_046737 [Sarracenia purpurea var. burkii]